MGARHHFQRTDRIRGLDLARTDGLSATRRIVQPDAPWISDFVS
ncbi:MAG: hypothetical protein ACRD68_05010 [Pyrinomonadaceae bacterium]